MTILAKITAKGQTTVPAEVRAKLGAGPGDYLRYDEGPDGRLVVTKAEAGLDELRRLARTEVRLTDGELERAIEDARAAIGGWVDRN